MMIVDLLSSSSYPLAEVLDLCSCNCKQDFFTLASTLVHGETAKKLLALSTNRKAPKHVFSQLVQLYLAYVWSS